ncbi:MAG: hypothetical protein ABIH23_08540 [bacterium]
MARTTATTTDGETPVGNPQINVTVSTAATEVAHQIRAASELPSEISVLERIKEDSQYQWDEFPPECKEQDKFRFVWCPEPMTTTQKQQFQSYVQKGYAVCNRDCPYPAFWKSFEKPNSAWRFDGNGAISSEGHILMVGYEAAYQKREKQRREAVQGILKGDAGDLKGGIHAESPDGARPSGLKTGAVLNPETDEPTFSGELQEANARAGV